MRELTLTANGRLVHRTWQRPTKTQTGGYELSDVTDRAEQFLFEPVKLAEDATLMSVFLLMRFNPVLCAVFKRHRAEEICVEAFGPGPTKSFGIDAGDVEYCCVYRTATRDSIQRTLSDFGASFHGVGPVLQEDIVEGSHVTHRKGTRVQYAFGLSSPHGLRDLPLRLDTDLPICEGNTDVPRFWEQTEHLTCDRFTLGEVLDAIFWELTFHGVGEERDNALANLQALSASIA